MQVPKCRFVLATLLPIIIVLYSSMLVYYSSAADEGEVGPIVPALCIFGDSVVDAGNNNNLLTLIKANFPPYGRDFGATHKPTGRFSNGKLATDFTAEFLGFTSYPPPYLQEDEGNSNFLNGANFASAASGYYDQTSQIYGALSLTRQVEYYRDWQGGVEDLVGRERAKTIFSGGIHLLSTGSSDFLQNYYVNPLLRASFSHDQFSDILINCYTTFIQDLYKLGARRIGTTTLPPIGCLPAAITLFGGPWSSHCIDRINKEAISFNNKLRTASQHLKSSLPGLKLVVFDVYSPLLDIITNPVDNGFSEVRRSCCGTGLIETSFLCNKLSIGTCSNATEYVFWDGFHPSEAANEVLANKLLEQGFELITP